MSSAPPKQCVNWSLFLSCGLRYARSKQKREGILPQRRKKKDKSNTSPKSKKIINKSRYSGDDQPMAEDHYQPSMQDTRQSYHPAGVDTTRPEDAYYGGMYSHSIYWPRIDAPFGPDSAQYYSGGGATRGYESFPSSDDGGR